MIVTLFFGALVSALRPRPPKKQKMKPSPKPINLPFLWVWCRMSKCCKICPHLQQSSTYSLILFSENCVKWNFVLFENCKQFIHVATSGGRNK